MNILQIKGRQRGLSTWTVIGSLLIAAGITGLTVALFKPGHPVANLAVGNQVAPIATQRSATSGSTDSTRSAAPVGASTVDAKTESPTGGPHPNWRGIWRGADSDVQMVITAARVGGCKWIDATEPRFDGECEAGYAKSSVSFVDISRRFEESVAQFQRDPSDFSISDPVQSRKLIGRIKPGNYRVIWMQDGSDCGMGDLIVDGDLMLRVVDCKYRHQISLFTRVR